MRILGRASCSWVWLHLSESLCLRLISLRLRCGATVITRPTIATLDRSGHRRSVHPPLLECSRGHPGELPSPGVSRCGVAWADFDLHSLSELVYYSFCTCASRDCALLDYYGENDQISYLVNLTLAYFVIQSQVPSASNDNTAMEYEENDVLLSILNQELLGM